MSAGRIILGLILGAAGGILTWVAHDVVLALFIGLIDPPPGLSPAARAEWTAENAWRTWVTGGLLGLFIGGALGVGEGLRAGTQTRFKRAVALGAGLGLLGGLFGIRMGQVLYGALGGDPFMVPETALAFLHQVLARAAGWALLGLFLGALLGFISGSAQRARNGAVGGLLGGLLGGFLFETLPFATGLLSGFELRLVGFTAIGGGIGLFVSLVDEALKQAWVRVLVGRNEGPEFTLDAAVNALGRDELAQVPIFSDPQLGRRHATIRRVERGYALHPEAGCQTFLNQEPVTAPAPLRDGDLIQLGQVSVAFYQRKGAPAPKPKDQAAPAPEAPPTPAGHCPYCGEPPDPRTGQCACAVGGVAGSRFQVAGSGNPDPSSAHQEPGSGNLEPGAARLVALSGPLAGTAIPLAAGLTLGRAADRDLVLAGDHTASRVHARLEAADAGYLLRDEGSANGTYVNGARVTEHMLSPGDEIRIGGSSFRFEG